MDKTGRRTAQFTELMEGWRMLGLIRLAVAGFVGLTVVYVVVSLYSRSVRRERLEERAAEKIAEGDLEESRREAFIEKGMRDYEESLRRKLILGVFVVPVIAVIAIVVATNFM
ncbi:MULTISPECIES: hypothetical protein [Actibacterium]|uniref:Uncharacterized protein n=1 Tax=Actibacterium naphthalenivorans TaxID=1614693 RepID=A0A840CBP6_9RHOB|nr:hypothetical protein [Actibacterium naphthalenivorans]